MKATSSTSAPSPPIVWTLYLTNYARHRLGGAEVLAPAVPPRGVASKSGGDPTEVSAQGGVEPTVTTNIKSKHSAHASIEGRCDADVMEYGAIAATAWVVDTGASYDSVPVGLAERRGWKRVPLKDPVRISTASGPTTSDFAIITKIPGMPEEVRAAELGNTPPLLSVGRRCLSDGCSIVWRSGRNPYFVTQEGTRSPDWSPSAFRLSIPRTQGASRSPLLLLARGAT